MGRKETEAQIREHLIQVAALVEENGGGYFFVTINTKEGYLSFNNQYYDNDKERPIYSTEFGINFAEEAKRKKD